MTKTVVVGDWDGDQHTVVVEDNSTVMEALKAANVTPSPSQQITSFSDAERVDGIDVVRDGETYLLTGNQVSG